MLGAAKHTKHLHFGTICTGFPAPRLLSVALFPSSVSADERHRVSSSSQVRIATESTGTERQVSSDTVDGENFNYGRERVVAVFFDGRHGNCQDQIKHIFFLKSRG